MERPSVPCPDCDTAMEPDQEVCAACRRPRDEFEIQRGYDRLRDAEARRRRRPRIALAWLLAGAAAVLLFRRRSYFFAVADMGRAEFSKKMAEAEGPGTPTPPKTAQGAAIVAFLAASRPASRPTGPGTAAPAAKPAGSAAPAAKPASPAEPAGLPESPIPPPAPENLMYGTVAIYGVIYDLKTTAPISGAVVTLLESDETLAGETRSDAHGRYCLKSVGLRPSQTYFVQTVAPGYRPGQIEDQDPPYHQWPERKREEVIAELSPGDLEQIPVRFQSVTEAYPLNLVLAPAAHGEREKFP